MLRAVLDQVDRHNGIVNAYCWLDREGALRSARDSEARWRAGAPQGLIDGVPVGIKDNILVAGMPARFGSKLTSDAPATHDAPAVARLREQGAIVVGKTTMPEFGWKGVTDSPLTGVTRNPWDTRKTPGGSSGGAVAAVVLGMGNLHLGTDGGGSIRIPAAFTGCYGLKPTRARVPAWPASPLGTLAHVGPLTRSVADAALAVTIMAAPDARDVYRDAVVKAFASQPCTGLDNTTFTLRDSRGALVPASVDQIGDGTWALFPNQVFLKATETYTARIDGRLCGFDGRCTAIRRAWRFTTAPEDGAGKGDTRVPLGFVRRSARIDGGLAALAGSAAARPPK